MARAAFRASSAVQARRGARSVVQGPAALPATESDARFHAPRVIRPRTSTWTRGGTAETLQEVLDEFRILEAPRFKLGLAVVARGDNQVLDDLMLVGFQERRIDVKFDEFAKTVD